MARGGASLVVAALAVALLVPSGAAARAATGVAADDGARVVDEVVVDDRTIDLTIDSPALGHTAKVRLWLPKDWKAQPHRTWPALWLLHGANEPADYRSWDRFTTARRFMADKDVLTVMPSDGLAGDYTDERVFGLPGREKWETFHTVEVRQIVQRGYRSSDVNVVAGISSGGYGAMIYAARHPGMFRAAASYSGPLDLFNPFAQLAIAQGRLQAGRSPMPFGVPILNVANRIRRDPTSQAPKLRGIGLYVSVGDGAAGPLDDPAFADLYGSRTIEALARPMSQTFVDRLDWLGIPVTTHFYSGGYHYWNYWDREFRLSWPVLERGLDG